MTVRKPRIFISYSHSNTSERVALARALQEAGYEVRSDSEPHRAPQDTHRVISSNVNWCDIVIPILTHDWLNSHECRDELVRAHERRRWIIPFRKIDVSNDGPPKMPFFLQEVLYVLWDDRNITRQLGELIECLATVAVEPWKQDCYKNLRSIGDRVQQYSGGLVWKTRLSRQILGTATDHLKKILSSSDCVFNVSHESNYLAVAEPIFGESETILAVCIAGISTFWKNPDFRPAASTYLGNQKKSAKSISRLFVFDSADEANQYKNILQAHYRAYGEKLRTSGVFLCSAESYRKLLRKWGSQNDMGALSEDFGLLTFTDAKKSLHALLNQNEFRYREYESDDVREIRNQLIIEHFRTLRLLKEGDYDDRLGVARWSPRWWDEPSEFSSGLNKLFADRRGRVRHYVLLRPDADNSRFSDYFYKLATRFQEQQEELRIVSIHADRRNIVHPWDGRFGGRLQVREDFEYIFAFEFENNDALLSYYSHERHSIEREKLYQELVPSLRSDFEELHKNSSYSREERQKRFESIEQQIVGEGYVQRYDVWDNEPLSSIVNKPGIPFQDLEK